MEEDEKIEKVEGNFEPKESKKKGIIVGVVIGVVILLVLIAMILVNFLVLQNPQRIFNKTIDKIFDIERLEKSELAKKIDSMRTSGKVNVSIIPEDSDLTETLEFMREQGIDIEKCAFKWKTQIDVPDKKVICDLGAEYKDDPAISVRGYYDSEEVYLYFEDIFEKYIKVDDENGELKSQIEMIFNNIALKEKKIDDVKKISKIFKNELKSQAKGYGTFEKEKTTVEINGKEVKVLKSTVILSEKEIYKLLKTISSNLSKNDEFVDCVNDLLKDWSPETSKNNSDISSKDWLLELSKDAENEIENASADNYTKISLYTKGILNDNLIGGDILMYSNGSYDGKLSLLQKTKNTFEYKIKVENSEIETISGTITMKEKENKSKQKVSEVTITVDIEGYGLITLNLNITEEMNTGIDKINTKNSVNMNELTQEDSESILEKLMQRPLIGEVIKNCMLFDSAKSAVESTEELMREEEALNEQLELSLN